MASTRRAISILLTFLLSVSSLSAVAAVCSSAAREARWQAPTVVGPDGETTFDELVNTLAQANVTVLGEQHDRLAHHLTQLEILCRLHKRDLSLSVGFEQFQVSFQSALDRYGRGQTSATELLAESEYFNRWGFDFRLYEPVLAFAQQNNVRLVALNAPNEWVSDVRERGLEAMKGDSRMAHVRPLEDGYRTRLAAVFEQLGETHGNSDPLRMTEIQLLWDETMAEYAARHAASFKDRRLLVLAGNGHAAYRDAIPGRIQDRVVASVVNILQLSDDEPAPDGASADYTLRNRELSLPAPGRLGVALDRIPTKKGLKVESVSEDSAAATAGIAAGAIIAEIDGNAIDSMNTLRLNLWDRKPGDEVSVVVIQDGKRQQLTLKLR